jgi:putative hydrolase of the HAD superfamily
MPNYNYFFFDLYNTLLDDNYVLAERDQFRLDNIYTILEKSLYPVKFKEIQSVYGEMLVYFGEYEQTGKACTPFQQVDWMMKKLKVKDVIVFKKVYDSYVESLLQISPKLMKNAEKALEVLKERGKKIALVSNTGRTPGIVLRMMMKQFGIYEYFDEIVFSDEIGLVKPELLIFQVAVRRLGALTKESIFIGDSKKADFEGAKNAGLSAHIFKRNEEDLYQLAVSYSGEF